MCFPDWVFGDVFAFFRKLKDAPSFNFIFSLIHSPTSIPEVLYLLFPHKPLSLGDGGNEYSYLNFKENIKKNCILIYDNLDTDFRIPLLLQCTSVVQRQYTFAFSLIGLCWCR